MVECVNSTLLVQVAEGKMLMEWSVPVHRGKTVLADFVEILGMEE